MCTFEPEKPEASVDRGARELPLSPGHDPSKTSSFLACNKRYVKCIKRRIFFQNSPLSIFKRTSSSTPSGVVNLSKESERVVTTEIIMTSLKQSQSAELLELGNCSICCSRMHSASNPPRILGCLHTFCTQVCALIS